MPITLTRRGWAFALAGATVWAGSGFMGMRDLQYLGILLSMVPLASLLYSVCLAAGARPQVQLFLSNPTPVVEDDLRIALTLSHRWVGMLRGTLQWQASDAMTSETPFAAKPRVSTHVNAQSRVSARGSHTISVTGIVLVDPLGVSAVRIRPRGISADYLAIPRENSALADTLTASPSSREGGDQGVADTFVTRAGSPGGRMREYRSGDSLRQVHWKQTARQGTLLVNLTESGDPAIRTLHLDAAEDSYSTPEEFEAAVSAAATIGLHWLRLGWQVSVTTSSSTQHFRDEAALLRTLASANVSHQRGDPAAGHKGRANDSLRGTHSLDAIITGRVTESLLHRLPSEDEGLLFTTALTSPKSPEPRVPPNWHVLQVPPLQPIPAARPIEQDRTTQHLSAPLELTGARRLLASLTLFGVWALVLQNLGAVFAPGSWQWRALAIAGAVTLVAGAIAAHRRDPRALALLTGTFVGALLLFWFVTTDGQAQRRWANVSHAIDGLRSLVFREVAPVTPAGAFQDVLLLIVLLVAMLSAVLLVGLRFPVAAAATVSLLLLVPAAVTGLMTHPVILFTLGLILLFLVWLWSPFPSAQGMAAAILSFALAALAIAFVPQVKERVWNEQLLLGPLTTVTVPDVTISLAEDLRARSNTRAFSYQAIDPGAFRFTLATLADFEGGHWQPAQDANEGALTVAEPRYDLSLPPTPAEPDQPAAGFVTVKIEGLISPWLPLPQGSSRVQAAESPGSFDPTDWVWEADSNTAFADSTMTRTGDTYVSDSRIITSDQVEGLFEIQRIYERGVFEGPGPTDGAAQSISLYPDAALAGPELAPYLALPDGLPSSLAQAASEVTEGAQNRLMVGLQLQRWFRSGEFMYDEQAPYAPGVDPGDPYQVMTALLEQKHGFCVHYASTFAVMARHLGAPTRIAIGYATDSTGDEGVVRGRDLHAWPEIFVDGLGWVAFEPTPGGAGGRGEDAGGQGQAQGEDQSQVEENPQLEAETPAAEEEPAAGVGGTDGNPQDESGTADGGGVSSGVAILVVVLGLTLLGALAYLAALVTPRIARSLRRRRRMFAISAGRSPAQHAWEEFLETAHDLRWLSQTRGEESSSTPGPRAHSPEALTEYLCEVGALTGSAAAAAQAIADAVVAERYGPPSGATGPAGATVTAGGPGAAGAAGLRTQLDTAVSGLKGSAARQARQLATPTRSSPVASTSRQAPRGSHQAPGS